MKRFITSLLLFGIVLFSHSEEKSRLFGVNTLPNPILFVTQVPIPSDTSTITTVFGNHQPDTKLCGRGGDLYILYPDGTLKNLTSLAGYGTAGQQGATSIAVREPSMNWNGTKAIFSMIVGAPTSQTDTTKYFWQLYEVTGLGELESPSITKVPNQPTTYNNTNPIYGTDEKIIFSSDRPRDGSAHLYPQYDEYRTELANTGLWSLDPSNGHLMLLDHSPSGDFRPIIDSYGRVIFSRWDHLERDVVADRDVMSGNVAGSFNYSDESAGAAILANDRTEYFPEPSPIRTDLLTGTNTNGFEFNHFFPWQINEDGTGGETINHIGRHDLNLGFGKNFTNDPNLVNFPVNPVRTNTNPITNLLQVVEDPVTPGKYYGVDCIENGTHGAGQLLSFLGAPSINDQDMAITYITDRSTSFFLAENGTPNATHTGHYRTPLPLSNGQLLAVHADENKVDKNLGTGANPVSRYALRIKTLKVRTGSTLMADIPVTPGVTKSVSYWTDAGLVSFSGTMWELDPVEVRSRTKPAHRVETISNIEAQVISEEGIDTTVLRNYLTSKNLALMVSRNVTYRNSFDHQQPYYLKVHNSSTQSPGASGKIYDIEHFQIVQAMYTRGYGLVNGNNTPRPGRRTLALPMSDTSVHNPPNPGGPLGSVKLGSDGSLAALVPAHRATSWRLVDSAAAAIVHERFWVTFQPGEIRTCAMCHGANGEASSPAQTIPQNKPEALRTLLQYIKPELVAPQSPLLVTPVHGAINQALLVPFTWNAAQLARTYELQLAFDSLFTTVVESDTTVTDTVHTSGLLTAGVTYYWRVRGIDPAGKGSWSQVRSFTTQSNGSSTIMQVSSNWNLLSIPVIPTDAHTSALFPSAATGAFAYAGGYTQADTLQHGKGYWMKFPSLQYVALSGTQVTADSIAVTARWNLVGALSVPISVNAVTSNPPGMITSQFYEYTNSGYVVADTLRPGKGYWVKTTTDGVLYLSISVLSSQSVGKIHIMASDELPPSPPQQGNTDNARIPSEYALFQNYPNPFNPVTTINYQIPVGGMSVQLKVYNMLGKEVATLVDGMQSAGMKTVTWDASAQPSGIYTYRLVAGNFSAIRKLILMK